MAGAHSPCGFNARRRAFRATQERGINRFTVTVFADLERHQILADLQWAIVGLPDLGDEFVQCRRRHTMLASWTTWVKAASFGLVCANTRPQS